MTSTNPKTQLFFSRLQESVSSGSYISLSLSQPKIKNSPLLGVTFRMMMIKNEHVIQGDFKMRQKAEVKNFSIADFPTAAQLLFQDSFTYAHLIMTGREGHLLVSLRGFETLKWKSVESEEATSIRTHDVEKKYIVPASAPFLFPLNIATQGGLIRKEGQKKYRQINKYVEIFGDLLSGRPRNQKIVVADMGCGKGYLTFAMYHWLHQQSFQDVTVTGVDIKDDVIAQNNAIARSIEYDGLTFVNGTIQHSNVLAPDVLVALHACDTATDDALMMGIQHRTPIIMVAPCCQKQVRRSIESTPLNEGLFRFGIMKERFTSNLTDLIRAGLLRYMGYQVKVMEFINLEHTPKNLLITATFTGHKNENSILEVVEWMRTFGIKEHYLLTKLIDAGLIKDPFIS